ncbi:hypothetical protein [Actinokineospora sp.]|uniref:hypothetical protein n=1 Tax=Actinokineospora sp. TaxID=1872133 RepID=UPI004038491B
MLVELLSDIERIGSATVRVDLGHLARRLANLHGRSAVRDIYPSLRDTLRTVDRRPL